MADQISGVNAPRTLTSVDPYKVPRMLWSLLETFFEQKYNVTLTQAFPKERVTQPVIAWRIRRRVPGGGKDGTLNRRGPSHTRFAGTDNSGMSHEIQTQQHIVLYEFHVFAATANQADEIAWDLEQSLNQAVGPMQDLIRGFSMTFDIQEEDMAAKARSTDDLNVRSLRYEVGLPIRYEDIVPAMRQVAITYSLRSESKTSIEFLRDTASARFDIPVVNDNRVTRIQRLYRTIQGQLRPLKEDVDYQVLIDPDSEALYINWLDEYGSTPAVNTTFFADYDLSQIIEDKELS